MRENQPIWKSTLEEWEEIEAGGEKAVGAIAV